MQNKVLVLCLFIVITTKLSTAQLVTFQQQALTQHNFYRQNHCNTSGLALNSTLNVVAQNYSEYLAANNLFTHSNAPGLGENLWMMTSSAQISSVNGKKA
ncbi:unnamed protein product [Didymodactylos carnosus]|uniref:SCP domain-containing protein n=1 Tax=Didymodactylos carnosus TaxID=1234261 RepID=A0A815DSJ3_9BILA|nr:unnamed protein product [Didymodactylos carnosus]CAF1304010.1 unnamed protein product [Didymodactylos carnosus]CAF4110736.1 unnamed protein product [Didymodactylos carnosus]CAF4127941.1 unnamed protein product [Didymodactylos carnosus]